MPPARSVLRALACAAIAGWFLPAGATDIQARAATTPDAQGYSVERSGSDAFRRHAWEGSHVGQCFGSIEAFLATVFGADYGADDNVSVSDAPATMTGGEPSARPRLVWVVDKTPGVNVTRTLLTRAPDAKACVLLHAPLSSSISYRTSLAGGLPSRFMTTDTPPPGFATDRIVYTLDRTSTTYRPTECSKVGPRRSEKRIDCRRAFAD